MLGHDILINDCNGFPNMLHIATHLLLVGRHAVMAQYLLLGPWACPKKMGVSKHHHLSRFNVSQSVITYMIHKKKNIIPSYGESQISHGSLK